MPLYNEASFENDYSQLLRSLYDSNSYSLLVQSKAELHFLLCGIDESKISPKVLEFIQLVLTLSWEQQLLVYNELRFCYHPLESSIEFETIIERENSKDNVSWLSITQSELRTKRYCPDYSIGIYEPIIKDHEKITPTEIIELFPNRSQLPYTIGKHSRIEQQYIYHSLTPKILPHSPKGIYYLDATGIYYNKISELIRLLKSGVKKITITGSKGSGISHFAEVVEFASQKLKLNCPNVTKSNQEVPENSNQAHIQLPSIKELMLFNGGAAAQLPIPIAYMIENVIGGIVGAEKAYWSKNNSDEDIKTTFRKLQYWKKILFSSSHLEALFYKCSSYDYSNNYRSISEFVEQRFYTATTKIESVHEALIRTFDSFPVYLKNYIDDNSSFIKTIKDFASEHAVDITTLFLLIKTPYLKWPDRADIIYPHHSKKSIEKAFEEIKKTLRGQMPQTEHNHRNWNIYRHILTYYGLACTLDGDLSTNPYK